MQFIELMLSRLCWFQYKSQESSAFCFKISELKQRMDKGKCLHNLFANQIFTVARHSGEVGRKDNPRF